MQPEQIAELAGLRRELAYLQREQERESQTGARFARWLEELSRRLVVRTVLYAQEVTRVYA